VLACGTVVLLVRRLAPPSRVAKGAKQFETCETYDPVKGIVAVVVVVVAVLGWVLL
jgi:hypothetical protein